MKVTITQTRKNGNTEVLVQDYPMNQEGDLDRALEEARNISVKNDGKVYPDDLAHRDVRIES